MDEAWQVKSRGETMRPTQHRFDMAAQGNLASLSDIRVLPSVLRYIYLYFAEGMINGRSLMVIYMVY